MVGEPGEGKTPYLETMAFAMADYHADKQGDRRLRRARRTARASSTMATYAAPEDAEGFLGRRPVPGDDEGAVGGSQIRSRSGALRRGEH
eukprot:6870389-Pyramimonas_sp.AAC.1